MASLTLKHVSCSFSMRKGAVRAIEDLSLAAKDGEFVVLVGPSGCGKTTTLRLIAGLERLSSGQILLENRRIDRLPPRARDVAMIFQNYALYPHMTVFQNLGFGLKVRRTPRRILAEKVKSVAATLGLTPLLDRKPAQLSGGEKQRVALGRAAIRRPALFLMDEPLSALDESLRAAMRSEIKALQRKLCTTTVYVTHDQEEAMTVADRIGVLEGGKLQQVGTPLEIYDRPANRFVAGFFGSPSMNFFRGEIAIPAAQAVFRSCGFEIPCSPSPTLRAGLTTEVVMGIRPHEVAVNKKKEDQACEGGALCGAVRAVEAMGDSAILRIVLQSGAQCTAKVSRGRSYADGETVWVSFPRNRMHFFESDPAGRSLT